MTLRNRKLSQVRFDKSVDVPTTNRAFDNIINNLNPYIDETTQAVNDLQQQVQTLQQLVAAISASLPP